jgi:DNA gyrase subunit A
MTNFGLSEVQSQAILDMRLQRLTALEREKLETEYLELIKRITYLQEVLANERLVYQIIRDELLLIRNTFGDNRRTQIVAQEDDISLEDLIAEEDMVVTLTNNGYTKRLPVTTYRVQRRGGRGVTGMQTRSDDFVERLFIASTHDYLCCFTNRGKMYRLKVHEIPEAGRQARGTAIINLLAVEAGEQVTAVIPVRDFEEGLYLLMATRQGQVKKTPLVELATVRKGGLIALTLAPEDELIDVRLTDGSHEVILVTQKGLSIRFPEKDVRIMGRGARGVRGITLSAGDRVIALETIIADSGQDRELLVVTENGFGKRTPLPEYKTQARGGKGIYTIRLTGKNGLAIGARVVHENDELMIITAKGVVIRQGVPQISRQSRLAQGVTLIRLDNGDRVVGLTRVVAEEG